MEEADDPKVRINVIVSDSRRERFFQHCRGLRPRRSMNAVLNVVINAVLDGRISLSDLLGDGVAGRARPDPPAPRSPAKKTRPKN